MEFHENKAKQPFIGFVLIWRAYKAWRLRMQTRCLLQQVGDERLRDVGLRHDQVEWFSFIGRGWGVIVPASSVFTVFINSCFWIACSLILTMISIILFSVTRGK